MPGEEQEGGAPKVVKKLKKIKKEPAPQLAPTAAGAEPDTAGEPPTPAQPAGPPEAAAPPGPAEPPGPTPAPVIGATRPAPVIVTARPAPVIVAARPGPESPRPASPPPKAEDLAGSFVPPTTVVREPPAPGPDQRSVQDRMGAIDIDRLTSELEKDILSTLTSEIGGILATPTTPPKEKKEVRDDHAEAAQPPPRRPPPFPPAQPEARAAENEQRERRVAYRLGREFDKLPVNMRNELIKTLSRTDDVKVREDVVIACASNFDKLPPEVRGLLRTLANDRDSRVREEVAFELNRNFAKITPEYRSELIPLLVRDIDVKVREDIVAVIASHFDRHPPEVQDLLRTLASDRKAGVRDQVSHEVLRNADKIPEAVKQELAHLIEKATIENRERE